MAKALVYGVGIILMLFVTVILSQYNNASKRETCEARGGSYFENEFHSDRSFCQLPARDR